MPKTAIVLHHTDDPSDEPQYEKVWAYHDSGAGGKWPKGHGIQYPHFIGKDGTWISQDDDKTTWHAGNKEMNEQGIGVCLAGDFTQERPTPAQIDTLVRVVTDIQTRYGIPDSRIFLHREVRDKPTECPGVDLRALLIVRRGEMLRGRLPTLLEALQRVTGPRKIRLQRLVDRLRRLIQGL